MSHLWRTIRLFSVVPLPVHTGHPDVLLQFCLSQVLGQMIDNFEQRGVRDGKVSREEFEDYYGSLGAYIDDDTYFALMLKRAWQME